MDFPPRYAGDIGLGCLPRGRALYPAAVFAGLRSDVSTEKAPRYADQLVAQVRARPWQQSPEEIARLIAKSGISAFSCPITLQRMVPHELRFVKCEVTNETGSDEETRRLIEAIERLRAGGSVAHVALSVSPEIRAAHIPPAPPLIPADLQHLRDLQKEDMHDRLRKAELREILRGWLLNGLVLAVGALIPGLRGRSLSAGATLAWAFGSVIAGAFVVWRLLAKSDDSSGFGDLMLMGLAVEVTLLFIGGLLFGNVVRMRAQQ